MINMKKIITTILVLICLVAKSQVPNDDCSTATNLGTLPAPSACPSGIGSQVNSFGSNINATYQTPYTTLLNCQTTGNQPGPALDVWYSVVASGNVLIVNISANFPVLQNPSISLWTGSCGSLVGVNCSNNGNASGVISATFQPITPGVTYYIQVSGQNSTSSGNFNLSVNNNNDCNKCNQLSSLTVSPLPVNGTYLPNTTVNFCYTVSKYNQVSANWFHGMIPTFGCGWDLATMTRTPSTSCSTNGSWLWFNSCTSSASGVTTGPGFYYDYTASPGAPGNNFGDNNNITNTCSWVFCWSIKTKANCLCNNLNISINTTGDGETGSWTSVACQGDPDYNFSSSMSCCTSTTTHTNVTCFGGSDGISTVTNMGVGPYTYTWSTTPIQNTQTINNLVIGTYSVSSTDNNGCVSTNTVVITQPTQLSGVMTHTPSVCVGNSGSASILVSGGTPLYTYTWSTTPVQNTQTINNLSSGVYSVIVNDSKFCAKTFTVNVNNIPNTISSTITSTNISCFGYNNGSSNISVTGGLSPYTYTWSTTPVQNTQSINNLLPGTYTVTIKDNNGCLSTNTTSITEPIQITTTTTQTNVTCFGGNNGSIIINTVGGYPSYTYSVNNVSSLGSISNLPVGSYVITTKDSKGCLTTNTVNISQPISLPLITYSLDTTSGCAPLKVNFTNTTPNVSQCNWLVDNVNINSCNFSFVFNYPGIYGIMLSIQDNNGCFNTLTQPNIVTVYPKPVSSFNWNSIPTILNPIVYFNNG